MMKTTIENHIAIFALTGLNATIQTPTIFTDGNTANEAGAPVIAPVLGLPDCAQIELSNNADGIDEIKISLKPGLSWDDKPSPSASKTRKEVISALLQSRLYDQKIALMTDAGQRYFDPAFIDDVQSALTKMAESGIIKTSDHNGGIQVIKYTPQDKSLTLCFEGACTTGCVGSRVSTEAVVTGNLCNMFPGAFSRPRIKFTDSTPT